MGFSCKNKLMQKNYNMNHKYNTLPWAIFPGIKLSGIEHAVSQSVTLDQFDVKATQTKKNSSHQFPQKVRFTIEKSCMGNNFS